MITVKELDLPGLRLLSPQLHHDNRGYLTETLNERDWKKHGLPGIFAQENQSMSLKKGTVRGLHAQKPPYAQGKLVSCVRGAIYDVAVDARPASPTFGRHVAVTMSEDDVYMFYIPPGFLHGFSTLVDNTIVTYKVTEFYAPGNEVGVLWNDPSLQIRWPVETASAILSDKDKVLPRFADMPLLDW